MGNRKKIRQKPRLPVFEDRWELAKLGPPFEGSLLLDHETPTGKEVVRATRNRP